MTAGELDGDLRPCLIRDGHVGVHESRGVYDRASALFAAAFRPLEGTEGVSPTSANGHDAIDPAGEAPQSGRVDP